MKIENECEDVAAGGPWSTLRRVALSGHQSESFMVFDQTRLEEDYRAWREEIDGEAKSIFGE